MDEEPEDWSRFCYEDCVCPHEPDEHGWAGCEQGACKCEAAWEE
jgi:hypothetical protein